MLLWYRNFNSKLYNDHLVVNYILLSNGIGDYTREKLCGPHGQKWN